MSGDGTGGASSHAVGQRDPLCPTRVSTALEFAQLLTEVRERAGLSVREAAAKAGLPSASAGGYFAGRHLPPTHRPEVLSALLGACGVCEEQDVTLWLDALRRARHGRRARSRAVEAATGETASTETGTRPPARTSGSSVANASVGDSRESIEQRVPDAHHRPGGHAERRAADEAVLTGLDETALEAARHLFLRLGLLERLGRLGRAHAAGGAESAMGPTLRWEDLPAVLSRRSPAVSSLVAAGLLTTDADGLTLTRPLGHLWAQAPAPANADPDATRAGVRLVNRTADWRDESQDPSHLLRGTLLTTTLRWASADNRKWLSRNELRYLAASEIAQAREHAAGSRRARRARLARRLAVFTLVSATGWAAAAAAAASGAPQ